MIVVNVPAVFYIGFEIVKRALPAHSVAKFEMHTGPAAVRYPSLEYLCWLGCQL